MRNTTVMLVVVLSVLLAGAAVLSPDHPPSPEAVVAGSSPSSPARPRRHSIEDTSADRARDRAELVDVVEWETARKRVLWGRWMDRAVWDRNVARAREAATRPPIRPRETRDRSGPSTHTTGGGGSGAVWDRLAACESSGDWGANTGNGYYGGLQFVPSTWRAYGGSGMPHLASREEQIAVAIRVQAGQGWGAWPACARRLGLL